MMDGCGYVSARVPWKLCTTMNNNWGYNPYDTDYKPASMLIRKLVECVSKGGNMILNVGPDARGNIPEESVRILKEIGKWMEKNKESILIAPRYLRSKRMEPKFIRQAKIDQLLDMELSRRERDGRKLSRCRTLVYSCHSRLIIQRVTFSKVVFHGSCSVIWILPLKVLFI